MTEEPPRPRALRRRRRTSAEQLAGEQEGVLSRRQLYALGVTRWQVRAQVDAGRWCRTGRQTVSTTTGPLTERARWWVAVLEVGPRAALDGVTALLAAGLTTITESTTHVIAPKSSCPWRPPGTTVHESRRFCEEDILDEGIRRVKPAVAAVHAALWAVSDRQAALFLIAPVQQRLVPAAEVAEALAVVRRHRRRRFLLTVMGDLMDRAQSLGELDFAVACRDRSLPEPDRQVVRRLSTGRVFLDVEWKPWGVVAEIDGGQHEEAGHRVADAMRDNEQVIDGKVVLRIPVLGLRLDQDAFLDQVERLLRRRGWRPAAEAA